MRSILQCPRDFVTESLRFLLAAPAYMKSESSACDHGSLTGDERDKTMKQRQNSSAGRRVIVPTILVLMAFLFEPSAADAQNNYVELTGPRRVIELAICLDASSSMDGLIDAAKQKLWGIVNDLALADPAPELRVALFTYGNDNYSPESSWVREETPFTGDLDLVSQRLFAITTDGGTEYVGRVLQRAGQLQWHAPGDALRLIVVAGNESADQDTEVRSREMCRDLITRGIIVNSIYCGAPEDSDAVGWRDVATLADGKFATIDKDNGTVAISTPFDDSLGVLSAALNKTYIPFGASGAVGAANQEAQDANAASMNPATAASRAQAKSSALYQCMWDLVDACKKGEVKLADVKTADLPEPMQALSAPERQAYLDKMSAQRGAVQNEIDDLSAKRDAFVIEEKKRQAIDDSQGLDNAMRKAILEQAEKRGIQFKKRVSTSSTQHEAVERTTSSGSLAQLVAEPTGSPSTLVQLVAATENTAGSDFTADEKSAVATVFENAKSVRAGNAKDDTRWVTKSQAVVPDVVVTVGTVNDWNLLYQKLKPGRLKQVTENGDTILQVKEQTILLTDGGC